jgi:GTP cyclohydrolase II
MAITRSTILPFEHGYSTIAYHRFETGTCVSVSCGDLSEGIPIVRIHSSCLFGEAFHALDCDCAAQLDSTLKLIREYGKGAVVYQYAEGRGIGLEEKIHALEIQRLKKVDTVEAFKSMGFNPDLRSYEIPIAALKDLKVAHTIKFASQNPNKLAAVTAAGFEVREVLDPLIVVTEHNRPELLTKKNKLGYSITVV